MTASRRSQRGASAVEFALVSMLLLTLVVAVIQYAIFFWAYQTGAHAAREGARVAAVDPCDNAAISARITARVGSAAQANLNIPNATYVPVAPLEVGDEVTVSVSFDVFEIGLLPVPSVNKTATSRIEYIPESNSC